MTRGFKCGVDQRMDMKARQLLSIALIVSTAALLVGCSETLRPGERTAILDIAPHLAPCTGVEPQECLLVRKRPDGDWQLFYDPIEGFDFEPGYEYTLLVAIRSVPDPPADGSSIAYRLLHLLRKRPV
jgi:hypothetical protein